MDRKITNKNGEIDRKIMTDNIINYSVCEITIMMDADMIINNNISKIATMTVGLRSGRTRSSIKK